MHFDFLPKVTHNDDAIRQYEQEESRRIKRWLKRLLILLPVILILAWLFLRSR